MYRKLGAQEEAAPRSRKERPSQKGQKSRHSNCGGGTKEAIQERDVKRAHKKKAHWACVEKN